jgi:uncharacterized protein (TIGR02597 family)
MNKHQSRSHFLSALAASVLLLGTPSFAQSVVSDPLGYSTITCLGNSDTIVSVPFTRPVAFAGAVSAISGSQVTISNAAFAASGSAAGFTYVASTQPNTYYLFIGPLPLPLNGTVSVTNGSATVTGTGTTFTTTLVVGDILTINGTNYPISAIASNTSLTLSRNFTDTTANGTVISGLSALYDHSPKEGNFYTITGNDATSVTVNLNGDSLSNVVVGTMVKIIPYWTLGTLFPGGQGVLTSPSIGSQPTQILLPDSLSQGIDLIPNQTFYYFNGAWRKVGSGLGTISWNDQILYPDLYFVVRNNTSVGTTFSPAGSVVTGKLAIQLATSNQGSLQQDNFVTFQRPVPVSLNNSGLIASKAILPSPGPFVGVLTDQVLVFADSATPVIDRVPTATYYYYNSAWRKVGSGPAIDVGADLIPAAAGVIIRKGNGTGNTVTWSNLPNY